MRVLKVLFVGIGSIAKRHIRNLQNIADEKGFSLYIDAFRSTKGSSDILGIDHQFFALSDVPDNYDVVFITNPTDIHLQTLRRFHNKGKHFFIEKPVVSLQHIEEAKKFKLRDGSVYYVACPLRYNAVIQYIKNNVDSDEVISVRSISSSYLPEWRSGQDYRKSYSAHKIMGGGVSIDLIHEWDYLTYLFGWPEKVYSMIGKKSLLEIDSDDIAVYIANYKDKFVELHLDYFGRETIREIQLFTKEDTITGDLVNNKIIFHRKGQIIDFHEKRDDVQQRELLFFLDYITGKKKCVNDILNGIKVLDLTQGKL